MGGAAKAIQEYVAEHASGESVPGMLPPEIDPARYKAHTITPKSNDTGAKNTLQPLTIIEGDFLALGTTDTQALGGFDAAWDRGSMVAVLPEVREQYIKVMAEMMAPDGKVLLLTVEHDPFQDGILGPPFSILESDLLELCKDTFDVKQLARMDTLQENPRMKERGATMYFEGVYLLSRKAAQ